MNSLPIPMPDCTVLNANRMCMPVNQAITRTNMNRPIFTLFTGTPTARELGADPPVAKIQLPRWVRSVAQLAIATNTTHQMTVRRMLPRPRLYDEAHTCRQEPNP